MSGKQEKESVEVSAVIKIGGSLFDLPEISKWLQAFIDDIHATGISEIWLVPGGGRFADEVRRLDQIHGWFESVSHALAMETMSLTARMISQLHPSYKLIRIVDQSAWKSFSSVKNVYVVDIAGLAGLHALPASWDVTSDSIAAWIALKLQAGRLILLKSTDLPGMVESWQQAADLGLVDNHFPSIAGEFSQEHQLEVLWVNARHEKLSLTECRFPTPDNR